MLEVSRETWPFFMDSVVTDLLLGLSQENLNNPGDAMATYASTLPYISSVQSTFGASPEHRSTTELLLHRWCLLVRDHIALQFGNNGEPLSPTALIGSYSMLTPFRGWSSFCKSEMDHGLDSRSQSPALPTRREVWRAYYDILTMLHHYRSKGASKSANYITLSENLSNAVLSTETRYVEGVYEAILLSEVSFPRANEANPEVETWTDQVMNNWAIQCAPAWQDDDLEKGGKSGMSRRILAVSCLPPLTYSVVLMFQKPNLIVGRSFIVRPRGLFTQREFSGICLPYTLH